MNPKEIFSFRQPRWYENIPVTAFLATFLTFGLLWIGAGGGRGSLQETVGTSAAFFVVLAAIVGGAALELRYEKERIKAVSSRLESLTTAQLVALSGSPELLYSDRRLVIDFLNQNREGWSFSIDTVNTTTR